MESTSGGTDGDGFDATGCGESALRLRTISAILLQAVCFAYFGNSMVALLHVEIVRFVRKEPTNRTRESHSESPGHS